MTATLTEPETSKLTVIGNYTVDFDADEACGEYPWTVYDGDMDALDCFETEAEAIEDATARDADDDAAEAEERLSDLQDEVQTLAANCEDAELLTRIKALLSK